MNENPCSNNKHPSDIEEDGESSMIALKQMPGEKCEKSNGEVQFSL
jgi:hypothetical protein